MSLEPLLAAPPVIQLHAFAAIAAFGLGLVQFAAPKGTLPHRSTGWLWVVLMTTVAVSSFWIHTIRTFGDFSVIHLLSILVLVVLPGTVLAAHRHQVPKHANGMKKLFIGALVIAGIFTFLPGRIMHEVVFGQTDSR
ncbi:DUF2306 domain-containing protein [Mesorhizobium sp. BR1-1-16]|uniref:DUF2306 domain-containing protein n=1 Tax=Mesorhizobium sp. BR1-1-16 TaxID=2876653 RepID=UPI001CCEDE99|nr:DUF2306 domain-containing protein [Mesorhizobium sp. BR1-1-16]MBZ9935481.1 DUF2306 domain-containing protein [Mesorhizobium sp. BR1-1-16]